MKRRTQMALIEWSLVIFFVVLVLTIIRFSC